MIPRKKWLKTFFYNFLWFIINYDFYVVYFLDALHALHQTFEKITNHRQVNNHKQPTKIRSSTIPSTDDPPTSTPPIHLPPTTNHWPTDKCSANPPTTDSPTGPSPITNSPSHRLYYNWPVTLWLSNLILRQSPLDW